VDRDGAGGESGRGGRRHFIGISSHSIERRIVEATRTLALDRRRLEPVARKPTALTLKTGTFRSNTESSAKPPTGGVDDERDGGKLTNTEQGDESECIICLIPLEEGDRVGKLPCSHVMHAECLKVWLKRKNTCPLCQIKEVATPQFDSNFAESRKPRRSAGSAPVSVPSGSGGSGGGGGDIDDGPVGLDVADAHPTAEESEREGVEGPP
jgi:Ring finger domain